MEKGWKRYRETGYEVSEGGEIRNIKTKREIKGHKKYNGKRDNDYIRVRIKENGEEVTKSVHRIVAECYLEGYREDLEVNHKNGIRGDNRVENLEMTTREENYQHSVKYGKGSARKPVYCIDGEGKRIDFKSLWAAGKYIKEKYGKKGCIDNICWNIKGNIAGRGIRAYGYRWEWL